MNNVDTRRIINSLLEIYERSEGLTEGEKKVHDKLDELWDQEDGHNKKQVSISKQVKNIKKAYEYKSEDKMGFPNPRLNMGDNFDEHLLFFKTFIEMSGEYREIKNILIKDELGKDNSYAEEMIKRLNPKIKSCVIEEIDGFSNRGEIKQRIMGHVINSSNIFLIKHKSDIIQKNIFNESFFRCVATMAEIKSWEHYVRNKLNEIYHIYYEISEERLSCDNLLLIQSSFYYIWNLMIRTMIETFQQLMLNVETIKDEERLINRIDLIVNGYVDKMGEYKNDKEIGLAEKFYRYCRLMNIKTELVKEYECYLEKLDCERMSINIPQKKLDYKEYTLEEIYNIIYPQSEKISKGQKRTFKNRLDKCVEQLKLLYGEEMCNNVQIIIAFYLRCYEGKDKNTSDVNKIVKGKNPPLSDEGYGIRLDNAIYRMSFLKNGDKINILKEKYMKLIYGFALNILYRFYPDEFTSFEMFEKSGNIMKDIVRDVYYEVVGFTSRDVVDANNNDSAEEFVDEIIRKIM